MPTKKQDRVWISAKEWKELEDKDEKNYCLHKDVADSVIKAEEGEGRTVKFAVSKNTVDRDGDTIKQTGWVLDNFKKNPVVIFGHDYKSLPIAKSLSIETIKNQLVSVAEFATKEIYPFADTVYQMIKGGFLNATSVGFKPLAYEQNDERGGYDFLKQELLEYSVVPIPSNPDALVQARDAGIDTTLLKEWAEKVLDTFGDDTAKGLMITKAELEELFKQFQVPQILIPQVITTSDTNTANAIKEAYGMKNTTAKDTDLAQNQTTADNKDGTVEEPKDVAPTEESVTPKEETHYLNLACQELILRGFTVKKDGKEIAKDETALEGKDFSDYSDDQIFDFMLREINATTSDSTFTIRDDPFDYELTELENKDDQLTHESFDKTKEENTSVEKINPTVLDCLMPKSYEAIAAQLRQSARNFLTGNGKSCEEGSEFPVLIATFQRTALFAVIGMSRSFDEDPTYEGKWRMNGQTGMAEWVGEPKAVDIQVTMNVVDMATNGKAASYKEKKEEPEAEPKEEKNETPENETFIDLEEDSTDKSVEKAVDSKLTEMSATIAEAIREAVSKGLRQSQGKLD